MAFRIANIHEYSRFIALDLWTHRVRASLYALRDGHLCHEKSVSVRQNRKNIVNGSISDMQWIAHVIEKAIHEVSRHVESIPEDLIIWFSPTFSLYDGITSQYIRHDRDDPLSMDEIDTMIEKIESASLARAKEKARTQYGLIHDDIRLISSTLTSIAIDGKKVTNPIGFTGEQVRITVLNVFTLASEYNILRSIVSSLHKNIIALVPTPLLFSKIREEEWSPTDDAVYIDTGLSHTTFVLEKRGEIVAFDTFPCGADMLLDMLSHAFPKYSLTEIENLISQEHLENDIRELRDTIIGEYFTYLIDTLLSLIEREKLGISLRHIFLSWGIFSGKHIESLFSHTFADTSWVSARIFHLADSLSLDTIEKEYLITHGLSLLARELLFVKKDPLIRILRYALYHYE